MKVGICSWQVKRIGIPCNDKKRGKRKDSHGAHLYQAKKLTEASFTSEVPAEVTPTDEGDSQQKHGVPYIKLQDTLTGNKWDMDETNSCDQATRHGSTESPHSLGTGVPGVTSTQRLEGT